MTGAISYLYHPSINAMFHFLNIALLKAFCDKGWLISSIMSLKIHVSIHSVRAIFPPKNFQVQLHPLLSSYVRPCVLVFITEDIFHYLKWSRRRRFWRIAKSWNTRKRNWKKHDRKLFLLLCLEVKLFMLLSCCA